MMDGLRADTLKAAVAEKNRLDMDVQVHKVIDSTNSWCLQQCKTGRSLPFACFAEEQTSGRGRRGKHWVSAAGANLAMSVVWPFSLSGRRLHLLPLSIALAIAQTLERFGMEQVQVKWPNDVYVQGKKIAGILIETLPVREGSIGNRNKKGVSVATVTGVGLNYDMSACRDSALDGVVLTDICEQLAGQMPLPERQDIASSLLTDVVLTCQNFQQDAMQNLEVFRTHYDYCSGKNVVITLDDRETLSGIAQGVNDDAELLVLIGGELQAFNSAEVSVGAACGAGPS